VPVVQASTTELPESSPIKPTTYPEPLRIQSDTELELAKQDHEPGRRLPAHILLATLALTVIATAWLLAVHKWTSPGNPQLKTVPLTSYPGSQTQSSFSPNGDEIAFVWERQGGSSKIFVKLIGSETPLQLTSGEGQDKSPAWSPEGSSIAFVRYAEGGDAVYVAPAIGGSERMLYALHRKIDWDAPGLSWSPDGNWLIFPDARSAEDPSAIYALSLKTLEAKPLSVPLNSWDGDYNPVFSPDGKKIAFVRGIDAAARSLYVMNADGSDPKQLTFEGRTVDGLTWTSDGSGIVFSSDMGGSLSLWKIASSGGSPERLIVGGDNAVYPSISRRFGRLAYSQGSAKWSIMRLDLTSLAKEPTQLFSSMERDSAAQYSPDDGSIAFQSLRSGTQEIWVSRSDGTGPIKLTSFDGPLTGSPAWSPDGRQIAFDSRSGGRSHIFVMTSKGGKPQALTAGDYNDVIPSWSWDGAWVYFASRRSGRWEVWKTSPLTKEMRQVTTTGAFVGKESFDRNWLYYTKYHQSGLWRRPLEGGAENKVVSGPPSVFWGYWSLTPTGIYYLNEKNACVTLKFWSATNATVAELSTLPRTPPPFAGISVSRNNHWLLYSDEGDFSQNIRMVENFY
jgi:Tol biopolymer transport system component